jgi:hypothetical protein
MRSEEIAAFLTEKFSARVLESQPEAMNPWSAVEPAAILDICRFMRTENSLDMDHLELLGGVIASRLSISCIRCSTTIATR